MEMHLEASQSTNPQGEFLNLSTRANGFPRFVDSPLNELDSEPVFIKLWWISRDQGGETLPSCVDHEKMSPAMAASSLVPTNAAQVLKPMRAFILAPISFTSRSPRPMVILYTGPVCSAA
jgi:hypothetical protein